MYMMEINLGKLTGIFTIDKLPRGTKVYKFDTNKGRQFQLHFLNIEKGELLVDLLQDKDAVHSALRNANIDSISEKLLSKLKEVGK